MVDYNKPIETVDGEPAIAVNVVFEGEVAYVSSPAFRRTDKEIENEKQFAEESGLEYNAGDGQSFWIGRDGVLLNIPTDIGDNDYTRFPRIVNVGEN